jgi:hypothetical protein
MMCKYHKDEMHSKVNKGSKEEAEPVDVYD